MTYSFRNTYRKSKTEYIEDRGHLHIVKKGDEEYSEVNNKFNSILEIGKTAIKISDSEGNEDWEIIDGFPMLDLEKELKLDQINKNCELLLKQLTSKYPDSERLTFDQQKEEALAYKKDENAECPMLRALAEQRGIEIGVLVDKVLAKAAVFSSATGAILGKRQAKEDALEAATDPDAVNAVSVTFE